MSLAENVGHKQEEIRTYETDFRDDNALKREMRHQMVFEMEEQQASTWNFEDSEQLDIELTRTQYEAEKLEDNVPYKEAGFGLEAVHWRSVSPQLKESILLSSKEGITRESEMSQPTKKEVCPPDTEFTSKKVAYKKTQERKLSEADVTSHYRKQRKPTKMFLSVRREEVQEDTVSQMEDLVQPKISYTSKIITVPKKSEEIKEVSLLKQTESVDPSERSIFLPHTDTVSPTPDGNLPQSHPRTSFPHHMTAISTEKDITPSKKGGSLGDKITKTSEAAKNKVSMERQTPEVEEIPFEEELVPAASGEVSPPVSTVVPAEEVTLPTKPIPKDETAPPKKVPLKKKPLLTEQEMLEPKKPTPQKVFTPEVDSPQEARAATTKPPPTKQNDKKAKKGLTLQKGIVLYFCEPNEIMKLLSHVSL